MTESARIAIAQRLRLAREQAGLSQGQAAKLLSLHRPTISEIEAGRRRVAVEELSAFADLYAVQVAWLAGEEGGDEKPSVLMAARQLEDLRPEDRAKVLDLIKSLKGAEESSNG